MQQKNSYPIVDAVTMATFPCNFDIAIVEVVKFLMHWKLEFMMTISYQLSEMQRSVFLYARHFINKKCQLLQYLK